MAIDWSTQVPLYRFDDGKSWVRLDLDIREKDNLSARFLGHGQIFSLMPGPAFALYDPSVLHAQEREQARILEKASVPDETWFAEKLLILFPQPIIAGVFEEDLLDGWIGGAEPQLSSEICSFLDWGLPPGQFTYSSSIDSRPVSLDIRGPAQTGTPLFDLSVFRMLQATPLHWPIDRFKAWVDSLESTP